jgi:hypothetical protein
MLALKLLLLSKNGILKQQLTMLSLNTVPKWVWRAQQEGLDVIIVNPGVIIGPGFPDQGSGELIKKCLVA